MYYIPTWNPPGNLKSSILIFQAPAYATSILPQHFLGGSHKRTPEEFPFSCVPHTNNRHGEERPAVGRGQDAGLQVEFRVQGLGFFV